MHWLYIYMILTSLHRLLVSQSDSALESLWRDHVAVSQIIYDYSEPSDPSDYAQ